MCIVHKRGRYACIELVRLVKATWNVGDMKPRVAMVPLHEVPSSRYDKAWSRFEQKECGFRFGDWFETSFLWGDRDN